MKIFSFIADILKNTYKKTGNSVDNTGFICFMIS